MDKKLPPRQEVSQLILAINRPLLRQTQQYHLAALSLLCRPNMMIDLTVTITDD